MAFQARLDLRHPGLKRHPLGPADAKVGPVGDGLFPQRRRLEPWQEPIGTDVRFRSQ